MKYLLKYSVILSSLTAAVVIGVIAAFGEPIADSFNGDNNPLFTTIAAGAAYLFPWFSICWPERFVFDYFSAVEEPRLGFMISVLRGFALVVPLALLLSQVWGVTGIWLTFPVTEALVFALMVPN